MNRLSPILLVLCLFSTIASAQAGRKELDVILESYLEAMGGRAALEQIISVRMQGSVDPVNEDAYPITVLKKRPDKVRVVMESREGRIVQAFNGTAAWFSRTSGGNTRSAFMPPLIAEDFIRNAPIESILLNPDKARATLNLLDDVEVAGQPAYQIEARLPNGNRRVFFIEKDTFLERRILNYNQEGALISEMVPSRFTRIDGIVFALQQINFRDGKPASTLEFQNIEVNVGLIETIFDPPPDLRGE